MKRRFYVRGLRRLLIAAFVMLAAATASAEIEVIETIEDGMLCRTVTFEGGGHFQPIALETGGLIPGSGMTFTSTWVTVVAPSLGPPESPFGPLAGFWGFYGTDIAEVTFTQPVATIDLVYIATMDLLLEAFDADGNLLMSALGPANFPEAAGSWDPMEVQVPRDSIASVLYLKFA